MLPEAGGGITKLNGSGEVCRLAIIFEALGVGRAIEKRLTLLSGAGKQFTSENCVALFGCDFSQVFFCRNLLCLDRFKIALGLIEIVIGLALQNAVGSVLSGLFLLFEQPFEIPSPARTMPLVRLPVLGTICPIKAAVPGPINCPVAGFIA